MRQIYVGNMVIVKLFVSSGQMCSDWIGAIWCSQCMTSAGVAVLTLPAPQLAQLIRKLYHKF